MARIFGRPREDQTGFWAVQLRHGAAETAVSGRYLCHERDAVDARVAAARLAQAFGMQGYTVTRVTPPENGWGRDPLPPLGGRLEVTNLFTWSQILETRLPPD